MARNVSVTANHVLSRKWASSIALKWPKKIFWTERPRRMVRKTPMFVRIMRQALLWER
jgi:hypothetical protein